MQSLIVQWMLLEATFEHAISMKLISLRNFFFNEALVSAVALPQQYLVKSSCCLTQLQVIQIAQQPSPYLYCRPPGPENYTV